MENSFQEMCRSSIIINRIEETSIAWCNSHLAARTDKGLHLFEFSKNLHCWEKRIDFTETFIKSPTSSPCSELLSSLLVKSRPQNKDLANMVLDTALWPHSKHLVEEMSTVVAFEWSPKGLLQSNECMLAIVNNIGSVHLYVSGRNMWKCVLDFSSFVQDEFSEVPKENAKCFEILKQAIYNLESCSVCWSPFMKEGSSYLVTGQKSGILLFWQIKTTDDVSAKCCGKINTDYGEIVTLVWIPKSDTHFVLICTYAHGEITALECTIDEYHVALSNSYMLWEHADKMVVQHLHFEIINDQLLIVFHKHRHLIIQLVDEHFKIISQVVNNVNDYRITSIAKSDSNFYIGTVNFKLYKMKYAIESNALIVDFDLIKLKDLSETSELYGICFSENNVICALSTIDRKVLHKKQRLYLEIIYLQVVPDNTELDLLLSNPTKHITNYWDCIELLRYRIVKTKRLPPKDYDVLLSAGNTDLYSLKIYLIIISIYKTLKISAKIQRTNLLEESIELIKDKILAAHATSNVVKIYNEHISNNYLSDLDMECFIGSKKYLELYSHKYKIPLCDLIIPKMIELTFEKKIYTCQNCDDEIIDFSCCNGHLNMFCLLTFTPIESLDYLSCKKCNTIARVELENGKPMCIFCDSYMNSIMI